MAAEDINRTEQALTIVEIPLEIRPILYIHQGPPVTPRGLSLVIKQQLIQLRILIPDLILTVLTECLVWPI